MYRVMQDFYHQHYSVLMGSCRTVLMCSPESLLRASRISSTAALHAGSIRAELKLHEKPPKLEALYVRGILLCKRWSPQAQAPWKISRAAAIGARALWPICGPQSSSARGTPLLVGFSFGRF